MEPENQAAFIALPNTHLKDGSGRIVRTMGFEVDSLKDSVPHREYTGARFCRINHGEFTPLQRRSFITCVLLYSCRASVEVLR